MADVALDLPRRSFFSQLFTFRGRSNRANYWLSLLAIVFGYMVVLVTVMVVAPRSSDLLDDMHPAGLAILYLNWAALIGLAALAAARRFHDRNKSGHWVWPLYVAPTVLSIADRLLEIWWGTTGYSLFLIVPAIALAIWGIVEVGFLRGTVGANRFGPDPLAK